MIGLRLSVDHIVADGFLFEDCTFIVIVMAKISSVMLGGIVSAIAMIRSILF